MNGERAKKEELARLTFKQEMPEAYAASMADVAKSVIASLKNRGGDGI